VAVAGNRRRAVAGTQAATGYTRSLVREERGGERELLHGVPSMGLLLPRYAPGGGKTIRLFVLGTIACMLEIQHMGYPSHQGTYYL